MRHQPRAGENALPSACRHFPREILIDPRGTFVSLSHYCPTAAALLAKPDALDATDALPPLLRRDLLCNLDGYAAWEADGLAILARPALTASAALAKSRS